MDVQDNDDQEAIRKRAIKLHGDGRWEGQLRLAGGSRKYVYAHSSADVPVRATRRALAVRVRHPGPAKGLQLSAYIKEWLAVTRSRVRPRTCDAYELSLHRIEALLGLVPLTRLNSHLIQRAYAELLASACRPKTAIGPGEPA